MRKILSLFVILIAVNLNAGADEAASPLETCTSILSFSKDHPLRLDVKKLETTVETNQNGLRQLKEQLQVLQKEVSSMQAEMGFREKYLWSWLADIVGGDIQKISNYKISQATLKNVITQIDVAKQKLSTSNKSVVTAIENWLVENDELSKNLQIESKRFYDIVCAGNRCLNVINKAIDDVSRAKSEDLFAGATDNKFLELVAVMDTRKANDSTRDVKLAVQKYRKELEIFKNELTRNHGLEDPSHIQSVNWMLQFVLDFNSGTSFMDYMNYFALSKVKDQLSSLKIKVYATHSQVEKAQKKLVVELSARICEARQQCTIDIP